MPRTDTRRRRPAPLVPVLVGAVLGLLLCAGGWWAGALPAATGAQPGRATVTTAAASGASAATGVSEVFTAPAVSAAYAVPAVPAVFRAPGGAVVPAVSVTPAVSVASLASFVPVPSAAPGFSAVPARAAAPGDPAGAGTPGCDDGSRSGDGGLAPATLPRGPSPGELLPAPYDGRGAAHGTGCAVGEPAGTTPGRAPPGLVPPSPMDLSILRV
ncbi:hypothetical protein [Streptomyces kanasensis]|uniref:hypothetical protein n=1 Tax=Streptomyces kanasensis TaxID=936756 RepID=UPI0037F6FDF4